MKKFERVVIATLILLAFILLSIAGFSQTRNYADLDYSVSTKKENVFSLELGVRSPTQLLYAGIEGKVFSAHRPSDGTAHALVIPKIYVNLQVTNNFFIDPFVGGAYHYGGNENIRISEVGLAFGAKAGFWLKNNGYIYLKPSVVLTPNQLYTIGIGFGGLF